MRSTCRAGFTIVELMIVAGLGTMVLMTIIALGLQMSRAAVSASRSSQAQVEASYASHLIERQLRMTTFLRDPSVGLSGSTLFGCLNAGPRPEVSGLSALEPQAPMSWYLICNLAGRVHYQEGPGCPSAAPLCGEAPLVSFGAGLEFPSSLTFSRYAPGNRVDYELVIAARDRTSKVRGGGVLTAPLEAP